jgi:hypothetical protein
LAYYVCPHGDAAPDARCQFNALAESNRQFSAETVSWVKETFGERSRRAAGVSKNLGIQGLTVGRVALGVKARILVFSIADSVLLKPLPSRDADRVFTAWNIPPPRMNLGFDQLPMI